MIDGVVYDTHDPRRDTRCVYGYFQQCIVTPTIEIVRESAAYLLLRKGDRYSDGDRFSNDPNESNCRRLLESVRVYERAVSYYRTTAGGAS